MTEQKHFKWYTGFFEGEQKYKIGNVTYIVESKFCPFPDPNQKSIRDRVENLLNSDLTDLTMFEQPDTIETEDVCSAVEKED